MIRIVFVFVLGLGWGLSFNMVYAQVVPTNPVIAPSSPTTLVLNVSGTFTFTSTVSDGSNIRYGIDWGIDGFIDEWVPSTGYVPSGNSQSVNHAWTALGDQTFSVVAERKASGSTAVGGCIITGCSGEICSNQETLSTCVWLPAYACYASQNAVCEVQTDSQCGWTMTPELTQCINAGGVESAMNTIDSFRSLFLVEDAHAQSTSDPALSSTPTFWTVTITAATQPNLISQNLTLSAGPYSEFTPILLNAAVKNIGTVSTGVGFSDNFSYQWDRNWGGWSGFAGDTLTKGDLDTGATSADGSVSFTPTRGGTLYIQHCVDSFNEIGEGVNENPNCTVSAGVTVAGDTAPTVNAGPDVVIIPPVTASAPNGASASDVEGPVILKWVFLWGSTSVIPTITNETTLTPTFSGMTSVGNYKFMLEVTDNQGMMNRDYMYIIVDNSAPLLNVASGPVLFHSGMLIQNQTASFSAETINGTGVASGVFKSNFTYRWGTLGAWIPLGADITQASLSRGVSNGVDSLANAQGVLDSVWSYLKDIVMVYAVVPETSRTDVSEDFLLTSYGTLQIQHCTDSAPEQLTESNESDNCQMESFEIVQANPDCSAQTILSCELSTTSYNSENGSCSDAGTCRYRCAEGGAWEVIEESCVAPTIPTFQICDDGGGGCVIAGGTKTVDPGAPLDIVWSSNNTTRCDPVLGTGFATGGRVSGTDDIVASAVPNTPETYRIACRYNSGTPVQSSAIVVTNVVVPSITSSRRTVGQGDTVTLSWDTRNGDETSCTLAGGTINGAATLGNGTGTNETGSADITILGRTTFVLTCGALSNVLTIEIKPTGWEG